MERVMNKTPKWFWVVAIFFLLWNILGVLSFLGHTFISEEALAVLPAEERALYDEYPLWTNIIFAIAVGFGFLGAIGLVLKKRWAQPAFLVSLLAIIPQMTHNVFFTGSMEVYGAAQAVTMPILVVLFGLLAFLFAKNGVRKSWLA